MPSTIKGRDRIYAPEGHERPDHRSQRTGFQLPDDLGFDAGNAPGDLPDGVPILLEHDPKGRMGKSELRDPGPETRLPFRRLRRNGFPVPEDESRDALFQMALLGLPVSRRLERSRMVSCSDPGRTPGSVDRPVKPGQHKGVPAIGLHPVSTLFRDQGGSNDGTLISGSGEVEVQNIPSGSRLVHER